MRQPSQGFDGVGCDKPRACSLSSVAPERGDALWASGVSRLVPVSRSALPYAAGIVKMGYSRFVAMGAAGSIIWIGAWGLVGKAVDSEWPGWKQHVNCVDYAVVFVVVLGACFWLVRRRRLAHRARA
jgi:membrane protein DedA with SNARE-associated domain